MYDQKIIDTLRDAMMKKEQTVAVAESVTAGHLQVALASAENASKFFQGGMTVYNLGQKVKHLSIEPIHAERCNCVSAKIAEQMSLQIASVFLSDWGIASTGYAAPMPECSIQDLFAFYAISFRGNILSSQKIEAQTASPMKVQLFYVNHILREYNSLLLSV